MDESPAEEHTIEDFDLVIEDTVSLIRRGDNRISVKGKPGL